MLLLILGFVLMVFELIKGLEKLIRSFYLRFEASWYQISDRSACKVILSCNLIIASDLSDLITRCRKSFDWFILPIPYPVPREVSDRKSNALCLVARLVPIHRLWF